MFVVILASANAAARAETATVELTDGSTLRGEVLSLKNNAYHLRTESLGTVTIPQSKVALVRYGAGSAAGGASTASPDSTSSPDLPAGTNLNQAVSDLMTRLQADPQALRDITALGSDPALQSLLEDPAIRQAILSQDYSSLASNPKVRALMNHPTVRKLSSRMQ
jgi:hypothetical protein